MSQFKFIVHEKQLFMKVSHLSHNLKIERGRDAVFPDICS